MMELSAMITSDQSSYLVDPARLAALQAVALLDTPNEQAFDRLTRLAARFVNAPIALVSLVDANRQLRISTAKMLHFTRAKVLALSTD
jgi:hypothetical protein